MYNRFDTLNGGTVARLRKMRAYVRTWNEDPDKKRRHVSRIDWRQARSHGVGTIASDAHGPTFQTEYRREWANIPASVLDGLRDVGHVDEIKSGTEQEYIGRALVDHRGWFADAHQDELYRGNVWQLPARDRSRVYLAGFVERDSGYVVLCARSKQIELFDSLRDAIYAADHIAQHHAEEAREYSEKWTEASECAEDAREKIEEAKELRALFHSLRIAYTEGAATEKELKKIGAQMKRARSEHAEKIGEACKLRERIAELDMQGEF